MAIPTAEQLNLDQLTEAFSEHPMCLVTPEIMQLEKGWVMVKLTKQIQTPHTVTRSVDFMIGETGIVERWTVETNIALPGILLNTFIFGDGRTPHYLTKMTAFNLMHEEDQGITSVTTKTQNAGRNYRVKSEVNYSGTEPYAVTQFPQTTGFYQTTFSTLGNFITYRHLVQPYAEARDMRIKTESQAESIQRMLQQFLQMQDCAEVALLDKNFGNTVSIPLPRLLQGGNE